MQNKEHIVKMQAQALLHRAWGNRKAPIIAIIAAIIYSTAKFFFGTNGFFGYKHLLQIKKERMHALKQLEAISNQQSMEIERLGGKKIDIDYLDELARSKLNYAKKNEIVIIYNSQQS